MLATQDVQPSAYGAEVGQELKGVLHQMDLLGLRAARLAARFATTNEYDMQGYATPIDWIRFNCHQTSTAAADLIAVGKKLEGLPQSVQAVSEGAIGFAHMKAMATTANVVGTKFDEALLLEKARESSPGKFYYTCHHYRHSADRKGFEAEQASSVENRMLWISTCEDGTVLINGVFDPEGGAALRTAWEPLARRSGAHDDRSREKRLADAAVEVAVHALDTGLIPQQGSLRTHLQVTTSVETLMGLPGAPAADMGGRHAMPRSPASCSTPTRWSSMSGGPSGQSQDRCARRSTSATGLHLAGLRAAGELDLGTPSQALDPRRYE